MLYRDCRSFIDEYLLTMFRVMKKTYSMTMAKVRRKNTNPLLRSRKQQLKNQKAMKENQRLKEKRRRTMNLRRLKKVKSRKMKVNLTTTKMMVLMTDTIKRNRKFRSSFGFRFMECLVFGKYVTWCYMKVVFDLGVL
jgi:hypothetical protein